MTMRSALIAAVFVLMLALVTAAPTASAHDDGLFAIITCEEGQFAAGDAARVEVHTFHNGQRVDVDRAPTLVFEPEYADKGREISTTNVDTGLYEGYVTITSEDVRGSTYGDVYADASVEISQDKFVYMTRFWSGEGDEQFDYLSGSGEMMSKDIVFVPEMWGKRGIQVEYEYKDPKGYPWGPGESVEFRVRVTEDGELVKPDNISIMYEDDNTRDSGAVPFSNVSTGVFDAFFTIPTDLKDSNIYEIEVEVDRGRESETLYLDLEVNFYQVWFHDLTPDGADRTFELCVADMNGDVISGAEVFFESYSDGYISDQGTTDGEGRVEFTINSVTEGLYLEGWVKKEGLNQSFQGFIEAFVDEDETGPEEFVPDPWGYGFEAITQDSSFDHDDDSIVHQFWGFLDGEPIENRVVYYYVHNDNEVLGYGSASTDDEGIFTITFDPPSNMASYVYVDLKTDVGYHPAPFIGYGWEDTDNDGFSDAFEKEVGTDHLSMFDYPGEMKDSDGDGLTDEFEIHEGTSPFDDQDYPQGYTDSDCDGYGDRYEEHIGTDPHDPYDLPLVWADSDEDGYGDDFEVYKGTDPNDYFDSPEGLKDRDGDGIVDDEEIYCGTDPDDGNDRPTDEFGKNTDGDAIGPGLLDPQYDVEEVFYGTDPEDPNDYPYDRYSFDTDHDGFSDAEEEYYGSDPENWLSRPEDPYVVDSDWDGICDLEEEFYGTDPLDNQDAPDREPDPWDERYADHNSTDGRMYKQTREYLYGSGSWLDSLINPLLYVEVRNFNVGGKNVMKVRSGTDHGPMAFGVYFVGSAIDLSSSMSDGGNMEWESWGGNAESVLLFRNADGDYEGYFNIPKFLPASGQEYIVVGGFDDGMLNYVALREGESMSSEGSLDEEERFIGSTASIFVACGTALFLMAIIFLVALLAVTRRKKNVEKKEISAPADTGKVNLGEANQGEITGAIGDDLGLGAAMGGAQSPMQTTSAPPPEPPMAATQPASRPPVYPPGFVSGASDNVGVTPPQAQMFPPDPASSDHQMPSEPRPNQRSEGQIAGEENMFMNTPGPASARAPAGPKGPFGGISEPAEDPTLAAEMPGDEGGQQARPPSPEQGPMEQEAPHPEKQEEIRSSMIDDLF